MATLKPVDTKNKTLNTEGRKQTKMEEMDKKENCTKRKRMTK